MERVVIGLRCNWRFAQLTSLALMMTLGSVFAVSPSHAQGCVAARGAGIPMSHQTSSLEQLFDQDNGSPRDPSIEVSVGYRWFRSHRHFVGDTEQTQRQQEGSEVVNNSKFLDLGISYQINQRFNAAITLPLAVHTRSQVVRANDANRTILDRFETSSSGMGDLSVVGSAWVVSPVNAIHGNVLLGLGVQIPTGNEEVTDTFQSYDASTRKIIAQQRPVDQSIQLGQGGWGVIFNAYAYRQLGTHWNTYVSGSYTSTPKEKNGVKTFRSNPYEAENSIADAYTGRIGAEYRLTGTHGLTLSLGGRIEGVPVNDLIGGSEGFRRPGYAVSIEPGLLKSFNSWAINLYAPVAIYRNRLQSVPDKQRTAATGVYTQGDAAFADYLVMFSITNKF
jgi:hypothetical protein